MKGVGRELPQHLEEARKADVHRLRPTKLDPLLGRHAGHRSEHGQAMVASRLDDAATQACGYTSHPEPVTGCAKVAADPPEPLDQPFDPVGLLQPELPCSAHHRFTTGMTRGEPQQRALVDQ